MAHEISPAATPMKARPWAEDVVYEALGNPVRLQLVVSLSRQGMRTSAELNPGGIRRPALLKQLSILCKAGLVVQKKNQKDERQCLYVLAPNVVVCPTANGRTVDFGCCMLRLPFPAAE